MKSRREVDVLVAEKVMGLKAVKSVWGKEKQYCSYSIGKPDYYDSYGEMILSNPVPLYSENIANAWEVVEKLQSSTEATLFSLRQDYEGLWMCTFNGNGSKYYESGVHNCPTAALAICFAALEAVGVDINEL